MPMHRKLIHRILLQIFPLNTKRPDARHMMAIPKEVYETLEKEMEELGK